jgi:hypothetical protein
MGEKKGERVAGKAVGGVNTTWLRVSPADEVGSNAIPDAAGR